MYNNNRNEVTIMSVSTNDSVTLVKEDNDGNFVVKQDNEVVAKCYNLKQALDIASVLLNRTQTHA